MGKEYDKVTAMHYSKYRPPLHPLILEKVLSEKKLFHRGLDIGCGTGQSSVALSPYCKKIIGIEPSQPMLEMAIPHDKVEYREFDGKNLKFPDGHFDVITLAGSLFYAKSQRLLDEVIRVSNPGSTVLVYDFEILLNDLFLQLALENTINEPENKYNHYVDFSGLEGNALIQLTSCGEELPFRIASTDLSHLMLSLKKIYETLVGEDDRSDPYQGLVENLDRLSNGNPHELKARIYYTVYERKQ